MGIITKSASQIVLVKQEIKICQGCLLSDMSGQQVSDLDKNEIGKLGLIDWWYTTIKDGKHEKGRVVALHENNHPNCYHYIVELVEKVLRIDLKDK